MTVQLASYCLNRSVIGTTNATTDTLHTQANGTGQINNATAYNAHSGSVTLSVYIVPNGVSPDAIEPTWTQEIAAGRPAVLSGLLGHSIPPDGSIRAFASTTNVVSVTLSGANFV